MNLPEDSFFPKGAIAFFIALIVGFGAIWLLLYAILADRHLNS